MTEDTATRNLAVMARMRLDKLGLPHNVTPHRVDDETVVCVECGFTLDGAAHSREEIRWMRDLVAAHDGEVR